MEMSRALGEEIFFIELWHFIALVVLLGVNSWFYRNGEKGPLLFRYLLLQAALLLWIVSKILKTVSPNETLRWIFIVTQYLGISFLGPLFFILIVATNPVHHLFYASYTFYRDTFGPLFYLLSAYTYSLIAASIVLFVLGMAGLRKKTLPGDLLIATAAVLPLLVNAVYTYRLFGIRQLFDYTPLFMTLSLVFFGIAAFRVRFLGILPAAWKVVFLELEDPLILVDPRGRVCGGKSITMSISAGSRIYDRRW